MHQNIYCWQNSYNKERKDCRIKTVSENKFEHIRSKAARIENQLLDTLHIPNFYLSVGSQVSSSVPV